MAFYRTPIQYVGLYNIAYMWGAYVEMIGSAVGQAVGPFYLELYKNKTNINSENTVKNLTIILQLLFMSFCFVISLWIKNIFEIFIKQEDLKSSYSLAIVIIMSYSYFPMYWNVINRLQYNEKTKTLWKITTAGGIINVFLNLILMPFFGYKVAVFTTFFSLMYIGFSGYYIKTFMELSNNNLKPLRWLLLIIILTFISYLFKDTSINVKALITIAVIVINLYCIKFKNFINIHAAN
jgi:O-antigen/teichoic acid export membrane protein